jgi:RNA polymerase sigma-70 factor (ECF subfamily)
MGGNVEARGRLIESYRSYLLFVAAEHLRPELRAKGGPSDLVQETFLEAHRDFPGFTGRTGRELKAWLRRILLNNLGNFIRKYQLTGKRRANLEVSGDRPEPGGALMAGIAADSSSPSEHLMRAERVKEVARALARLSQHDYQLVSWRHFEQLTFEQIGQKLGCSPVSARKAWLKALGHLQRELSSYERGIL